MKRNLHSYTRSLYHLEKESLSQQCKYLLLGFGIAFILAVLIMLWPKPVRWEVQMLPKVKQPYGTFLIKQLLQSIDEGANFVEIDDSVHARLVTDPNPGKVDNYVFVGEYYYGNDADVKKVMEFVAAGNRAFIITDKPHQFLAKVAHLPNGSQWQETVDGDFMIASDDGLIHAYDDTLLRMEVKDLANQTYKYDIRKLRDFETVKHKWTAFSTGLINETGEPVQIIGEFDGQEINAIRVNYGKGEFLFNSTNLAFSNFSLKEEAGMMYGRAFFSHLGSGMIYWDEENLYYQINTGQAQESSNPGPNKPSEGPLEFILSQKNLKQAWYLLLITIFIYIVFASKRKQRPVQTMLRTANTSIAFTEVVSQLFLNQKDHYKLVQMKMELWKSFVRERYRINWPEQDFLVGTDIVPLLSAKSGMDAMYLSEIITIYNDLIQQGVIDTNGMLDFHSKLETFYSNCK
jgi:hypothetical protein